MANEEMRHEPDSFNVRGITLAVVSLAGAVIVVLGLMWGLQSAFYHEAFTGRHASFAQSEMAPEKAAALIDADQPADLRNLRAREREGLETFAWKDREAKVARIPIDLAIEVMAKQELPAQIPGVPLAPAADQPESGSPKR